jgi:hypothetical protein
MVTTHFPVQQVNCGPRAKNTNPTRQMPTSRVRRRRVAPPGCSAASSFLEPSPASVPHARPRRALFELSGRCFPRPAPVLGVGITAALVLINLAVGQQPSHSDAPPAGPVGSNTLGWVGVDIESGRNYPTIVEIFEGGPARTNGIVRYGMLLTGIAEGGATNSFASMKGVSAERAARMLRGPVGSRVALRLARQPRPGEEGQIIVELVRGPLSMMSHEGVLTGVGHLEFKHPSSVTNPPGSEIHFQPLNPRK